MTTAEASRPSPEIPLDFTGNVFNQLWANAQEQSRPDMVGLEWRDETGLLHRVAAHDTVHAVTKVAVAATRLPRLILRDHIHGGPMIGYRTKYQDVPQAHDYWRVEVLDESGDVIDMKSYTGADKFAGYFTVNAQKNPNVHPHIVPRRISAVRWTESLEPDTETLEHIPLHPPLPVSLDFLAYQQEQLGLPSWQGLAWTDQDGLRKKVLRDEVIQAYDWRNRQYHPKRVFDVRTQDHRGTTVQRFAYSAENLQDHFALRSQVYPSAPPLDLHWEITPSDRDNPRIEIPAEVMGSDDLPPDTKPRVREAVREVHGCLAAILKRLDLLNDPKLPPITGTQILKALKDQGKTSSSSDSRVNPFGESPEAHQLRLNLVDLWLGQIIKEGAVIDIKREVPDFDGEKPIKRTVHFYEFSADFRQKFQFLFHRDLLIELLARQKISDQPGLTPEEIMGVGTMIRRSLGIY